MLDAAVQFGVEAAQAVLIIEDFFKVDTNEQLGAVVTLFQRV
jgi:hypothetical protein